MKRTLRDKHLTKERPRASHILSRLFFSDSAPALQHTEEGVKDALAKVIDDTTQIDEANLRRYLQQLEGSLVRLTNYKFNVGGDIPLTPGANINVHEGAAKKVI